MNPFNFKLPALVALSVMAFTGAAVAQEYSLNLTDPDKPAVIEASIAFGAITVVGYDGKTVEITTDLQPLNALKDNEQDGVVVNVNLGNENEQDEHRSIKGLKRVNNTSVQIEIEERNNKVEIGSHTRNKMVNLTLKVPYSAALRLSVNRGGDIKVSDVQGALELGNVRGSIYAENVSGPIVAESNRRDIEVSFAKLDQSEPSSLTSHRGSIDVSIPKQAKGTVEVQTYKGEIFSGLTTEFVAENTVDHKQKGQGQEITIGGLMAAKLNGGGQKLTLATFRGNIYVREK